MDARLIELIRRRERLLVRAEAQRDELAGIVRHWRVPVAAIDHTIDAVRTLKAHPVFLAFPLAVLVLWQPRRVAAWSGRAWMMWRFWQSSPLVKWLKHVQQ